MEGQLSLFPEEEEQKEERKLPAKTAGKRKENENGHKDPDQIFDERMKRFWHYMETKGMNEQWIETAEGELRIIIEALADYHDMMTLRIDQMEAAYAKAVWTDRLERIKRIQDKLEESTGYSRDRQLEICMKKRKQKKDDGIGEDALVLASRGKK